MSERSIWASLIGAGLTPEGAAGAMGNAKAESSMKANIAQRGMTKLSDEDYTRAADNGTIDFVHDGVGYGLFQWTYHTRKAGLLDYARECWTSVGDEAMQVDYFLKELQDYPGVLSVLMTSHDLRRCSDIVCTEFERPAVNNLETRYKFALEFYEQCAGQAPEADEAPVYTAATAAQAHAQTPARNEGGLFANLFGTDDGIKMKSAKMPVLKEGDNGAGVAAVQAALAFHKVGMGESGTYGIFGTGTTLGVKEFQRRNGLKATGQVDPATWSRLML